MGISVREALHIGGLQKATLLGGSQGLDKNIEYVSVIETPHVARWLKGDELMISAFYSIKNIDEQIRVLEAMHKAGSAALVICYPEIFGTISPLLIQKADEFAIPLLSVPEDVRYVDIITPLSRAISQMRIEQLEFINNLHGTFSDIVLQGKDLNYFAESLRQLTRLPVMMLDSEMKPVIISGLTKPASLELEYKQLVQKLKAAKFLTCLAEDETESYYANFFPIKINGQIEGAVCMLTRENLLGEQAKLAGEQAAIIYGWYILKDKSVKEALNRESRDFLDTLLNDHSITEDALKVRANSIGLNTKSAYCAIIISFLNHNVPNHSQVLHKIINLVKEKAVYKYPNSLIVQTNENIVVILAVSPNQNSEKLSSELMENTKQMQARIDALNAKCIIGIGRTYPLLSNVKQSYTEAKTAIQIARDLPQKSSVLHIDEVEEYALLFELRDKAPSLLRQTNQELNKLINYDAENGTDFFRTLQTLFIANQDINKAADMLFVHRNTVVYRKDKLKTMLTLDPFAVENRFRFELALRLHVLNKD